MFNDALNNLLVHVLDALVQCKPIHSVFNELCTEPYEPSRDLRWHKISAMLKTAGIWRD